MFKAIKLKLSVETLFGFEYKSLEEGCRYDHKGESPAATLCRGGGIRTTYLELLSSNLVCKPNLGATFDF